MLVWTEGQSEQFWGYADFTVLSLLTKLLSFKQRTVERIRYPIRLFTDMELTALCISDVHESVHPCFAVSTHPRHQPAAVWVNSTRYCKYGMVLLMMGENIARNM
jgi:hypothetical protein